MGFRAICCSLGAETWKCVCSWRLDLFEYMLRDFRALLFMETCQDKVVAYVEFTPIYERSKKLQA